MKIWRKAIIKCFCVLQIVPPTYNWYLSCYIYFKCRYRIQETKVISELGFLKHRLMNQWLTERWNMYYICSEANSSYWNQETTRIWNRMALKITGQSQFFFLLLFSTKISQAQSNKLHPLWQQVVISWFRSHTVTWVTEFLLLPLSQTLEQS